MKSDATERWPPSPVVLGGKNVALEPLSTAHLRDLQKAAADGELWNLWYTTVPNLEQTEGYIARALDEQKHGRSLPFAVRMQASGDVIGTTRYMNIEPDRRRLEIGSTWYANRAQRTAVNSECKLLLLTHAFEKLSCIAVEFRTHYMNFRSREAIARLGAKQDGILRNHIVMPGGLLRDTVVFSILAGEWPAIKRHLIHRMQTHTQR